MKKLFICISIMSVALLGSEVVFADTVASTTASSQIQSLLSQIQNLQAQLSTLNSVQAQLQTAQGNVTQTLKLIRSLSQGMSGSDVTTLQTILAADPSVYPQGLVTGFYGKMTSDAVKKFQAKNGLETVGYVGPKTLLRLNTEIGNLGLSEENEASTTVGMMNSGGNNEGNNGGDNKGQGQSKKLCVKIPPGHLIAPGWLKKNGGVEPVVPTCQTLPAGIQNQLTCPVGTVLTGMTASMPAQPICTTPVVSDTVVPLISSITANVLATTTNVAWTTNKLATTALWYGTTSPLVIGSASRMLNVSGLSTSHSLLLSGLATSTLYNYVVVSSDLSKNTATSSQNSFTTLAQ